MVFAFLGLLGSTLDIKSWSNHETPKHAFRSWDSRSAWVVDAIEVHVEQMSTAAWPCTLTYVQHGIRQHRRGLAAMLLASAQCGLRASRPSRARAQWRLASPPEARSPEDLVIQLVALLSLLHIESFIRHQPESNPSFTMAIKGHW